MHQISRRRKERIRISAPQEIPGVKTLLFPALHGAPVNNTTRIVGDAVGPVSARREKTNVLSMAKMHGGRQRQVLIAPSAPGVGRKHH